MSSVVLIQLNCFDIKKKNKNMENFWSHSKRPNYLVEKQQENELDLHKK
jgi:hypothetical protein